MNPVHLKKNEKIKVSPEDYSGVAIFESDTFNKGDKIYFRITSKQFNDKRIMFAFFDSYKFRNKNEFFKILADLDAEKIKDSESVYSDWTGEGTTNFYTIKKDGTNLKNNIKGKLLVLVAYSSYDIYFDNYYEKKRLMLLLLLLLL